MKYRKLKVIVVFLLASRGFAAVEPIVFKVIKPVSPQVAPIPKLVKALSTTESKGRANAIGDGGEAFGILQIHESMLDDYSRITGRFLKHSEMFTPAKAREVANVVLRFYANHIFDTTGRPATMKELAFIWNGGGSAWVRALKPRYDSKQRKLEAYWTKVSKNLDA